MRQGNWLAAMFGVIIFVFVSNSLAEDFPFGFASNSPAEDDGKANIVNKLDRIILRNVEFKNTPFREALKFLQSRSAELDEKETNPTKKGINFLLLANSSKSDAPITLKISDVRLGMVLSLAVAHARMEYKINSKGVIIVPHGTIAKEKAEEEARRKVFVEKKLKGIILPSVEFQDTPLREALKTLQEKSVEFDVKESNPAKKGVKFVVRPKFSSESIPIAAANNDDFHADLDIPITLKLNNVSLATALKYTVSLAQIGYKVEPPVVRVYGLTSHGEGTHHGFYINVYIVPPTFLSGVHGEADSVKGKTAKDILIGAGVTFPPGSSARFNSDTSSIIVHNLWDQMKLIETYVQSIKGAPVLDWH